MSNKLQRDTNRRRRGGFTLAEVLVVVSVFAVTFILLAPFVRMARIRAARVECANNLMRISLGLHAYSAEHDGAFPAKLEGLYPNYVEAGDAFDCPASKVRGSPSAPDYIYKAGLSEASDLKEAIVEEADVNHGKSGRNVLKIDGSIEWLRTR